MNPISPFHLTPLERRAELCRLLARGLGRLRMRDAQLSAAAGESSLHFPPDRSVSAIEPDRRPA